MPRTNLKLSLLTESCQNLPTYRSTLFKFTRLLSQAFRCHSLDGITCVLHSATRKRFLTIALASETFRKNSGFYNMKIETCIVIKYKPYH